MSQWLVKQTSTFLASRSTRRGFLQRSAMAATALSVAPLDFTLKPMSAYAAICTCAGKGCDCGAACCDGYTQFCCTINNGVNACPPGTFSGGWWKADGSVYCAGPRYYIDCHGACQCSSGCSSGFCSSCDGLSCGCALGNCNNRHAGCTQFRYGQCHQDVACVGRIACRVVSCTAPYVLDTTCSRSSATDNATANHFAPCQDGTATVLPTVVGMAVPAGGKGYWIVASDGGVFPFGAAPNNGSAAGVRLTKPVVGMAAHPGGGYWLVATDGGVFNYGAPFDGSTGAVHLAQPIVGMAAQPGGGYWLVASDGGIFAFDAPFYGSTGAIRLNKPVVGMASTPTGKGYWLVASDGGIFTFGDAAFYGSTGAIRLNKPIVGMASTPTGKGYWLVASDGGIFTFGDAAFYGSTGAVHLIKPIVGMASTPTGKGYWLVASDGGIFTFGDAAFYGSHAGTS